MTMPDERMRSIRWGGELLTQMAEDALLPAEVIAASKRIASTYPTPESMNAWLLSTGSRLSAEWAAAFADALDLFTHVKVSGRGSEQTRRDLKYTLRHYPEQATLGMMSRATNLDDWLRPDPGS